MPLRPATPDDMDALVDLHHRVYPDRPPQPTWAPYFRKVLFEGPWQDPDCPSWAIDGPDGKLNGFLGSISHRMAMKDRVLRVCVSSYYLIAPEHRSTLAGVQLLKKLFAGPQDMTVAEGNADSKRVWCALGGTHSPLYSIHWSMPLRPARYTLDQVSQSPLLAPARWLSSVPDWFARSMTRSPFRRDGDAVAVEPLAPRAFAETIEELSRYFKVRPCYDEHSANWFIRHLERKRHVGKFHADRYRNDDGETVGYALYFTNHGNPCLVVSMAARPGFERSVMNAVAQAAVDAGGISLTGRFEPRFQTALAASVGVFSRHSTWTLLHTRKPEILATIASGDALMTRLENEWWVQFQEYDPD